MDEGVLEPVEISVVVSDVDMVVDTDDDLVDDKDVVPVAVTELLGVEDIVEDSVEVKVVIVQSMSDPS